MSNNEYTFNNLTGCTRVLRDKMLASCVRFLENKVLMFLL